MKIKLLILAAAIVFLLGGCDAESVSKLSFPTDFKSVVIKYSAENNLDPYIVYGVIKRESKFIHDAESGKGAKGLMQLTEATAQWTAEYINMDNFDAENISDPAVNIRLGCAYFAHLLEVYNGNTELALSAYNAGMGNVNTWLEEGILNKEAVDISQIPYEETREYVKDVLSYSEKYRQLYPDLV